MADKTPTAYEQYLAMEAEDKQRDEQKAKLREAAMKDVIPNTVTELEAVLSTANKFNILGNDEIKSVIVKYFGAKATKGTSARVSLDEKGKEKLNADILGFFSTHKTKTGQKKNIVLYVMTLNPMLPKKYIAHAVVNHEGIESTGEKGQYRVKSTKSR